MPAVDPKKLKRLLVTEMLTPFAMKRKLSSGQLSDLVRRAMDDGRFDLSGSSDDFAHYMTEDEAADWADQLDKGGSAPHVFSTQDKPTDASTEKYGGLSTALLSDVVRSWCCDILGAMIGLRSALFAPVIDPENVGLRRSAVIH